MGAKKKISDNPYESMRCPTIFRIAGMLKDVDVNVTNFETQHKGVATIAGDVFDVPIRPDIMHRVVFQVPPLTSVNCTFDIHLSLVTEHNMQIIHLIRTFLGDSGKVVLVACFPTVSLRLTSRHIPKVIQSEVSKNPGLLI